MLWTGFPVSRGIFLPESLEKLGVQAFASCHSLEEIHWKKSVEEIPDFAFTRCRSLHVVEIPEGTKRLGGFAFRDCERLCFVSLPSSLEHIHKTAFKGCPCDSLVQQKYSSKFAKQQKKYQIIRPPRGYIRYLHTIN